MDQEKDYICDKCNKEMYVDEIGYLGAPGNWCHPFIKMECLCRDCYDGTKDTEEKDS